MKDYTEVLPQRLKDLGWRLEGEAGYYRGWLGIKKTESYRTTGAIRGMHDVIVQMFVLSDLGTEARQYLQQNITQLSFYSGDNEGGIDANNDQSA